jgi:hypothetical protein
VDSGADYCTFPLSFAKALGFDLLAKQPGEIAGVGNSKVEVFYWDVEIDFPGVTKFRAFVGFTNGLEAQGFGLLGQTGFFDRFKTIFDHSSKFFHVEIP